MAKILCIETSTDVCSVCISDNGKTIAVKEDSGRNHASLLAVFIEQLLADNNLSVNNLDAVAISSGPGSYTGLRIGTSTAKGIAYQADLKLIAVNTLQALALTAINKAADKEKYIAVIDAGRNEVYAQTFDNKNIPLTECRAEIISPENYENEKNIIFVGNAADKISKILLPNNEIEYLQTSPSSAMMSTLAQRAFEKSDFQDVAYFEPYYLKDFIATVSKKNPLKK